ncbi:MAG: pantoate--beta-alanine ligase [Acidobacteria bacterium]|nr:pantoate--beta-alanine ligase [Acidobacteriota bacterium]
MVETVLDLEKQISLARSQNRKIVFVPTMGALHEGHLSLVRIATEQDEAFVILSIFVNPTQFGKNEDFDRYPRTLDEDLAKLDQLGEKPDLVFVPSVAEVYPGGLPVSLVPRAGAVGSVFEGAIRPGHFDGMLHVVNWFFRNVDPDVAIFGAKDAQQLYLIRRMVKREFDSSIKVIEGATVREADGLALSSRNRFLSSEARQVAPRIYETLQKVRSQIESGEEIAKALEMGRLALTGLALAKLDYLALVDKSSFQPISAGFTGIAQLLVAVNLDGVRLIDNISFTIQEPA